MSTYLLDVRYSDYRFIFVRYMFCREFIYYK